MRQAPKNIQAHTFNILPTSIHSYAKHVEKYNVIQTISIVRELLLTYMQMRLGHQDYIKSLAFPAWPWDRQWW